MMRSLVLRFVAAVSDLLIGFGFLVGHVVAMGQENTTVAGCTAADLLPISSVNSGNLN
jgi:hypothetical protein